MISVSITCNLSFSNEWNVPLRSLIMTKNILSNNAIQLKIIIISFHDNSNILSFLYMLLPQEIRQYLWLFQHIIPNFMKTHYFNLSEIDISFL
jgi:hypothetical protein